MVGRSVDLLLEFGQVRISSFVCGNGRDDEWRLKWEEERGMIARQDSPA